MKASSANKARLWRLAAKRVRKEMFAGRMTPSFFRFMPKSVPARDDMAAVMEDTFEDWTGEKRSRKRRATKGSRKYTKALYDSLKREKQRRDYAQGSQEPEISCDITDG